MLKRVFEPGKPIYARQAMQTHGFVYAIRDEIPWKDLDIPQRTAECWFRLKMVSHFPGGDQSKEAQDYYRGATPKITPVTSTRRSRKKS